MQFLDEAADLLMVMDVGTGQVLHQELAGDRAQRAAVLGLLLVAVDASQDVDVVPPLGHDSSRRLSLSGS